MTATSLAATRAALDRLDHLLVVAARGQDAALARLPYGKQLVALLKRVHEKRRRALELACRQCSRDGADRLPVRRDAGFCCAHVGRESHSRMSRAKSRERSASSSWASTIATNEPPSSLCWPRLRRPPSRCRRSSRGKKPPGPLSTLRLFGTRSRPDLAAAQAQALRQQPRALVHGAAAERADDRRLPAGRSNRSRSRAASARDSWASASSRSSAQARSWPWHAATQRATPASCTCDTGLRRSAAPARRARRQGSVVRHGRHQSQAVRRHARHAHGHARQRGSPRRTARARRPARAVRHRRMARDHGESARRRRLQAARLGDGRQRHDDPSHSHGRRGAHDARRHARTRRARKPGVSSSTMRL